MAFEGWLIKINGVEFPTHYILYETYKSTPNQRTDLDSYTDGDGVLHRNILPHRATKIEFNTIPMWTRGKQIVQQIIANRDKVAVDYWNEESETYESGEFYIPDVIYEHYRINKANNTIFYKPIRIALIEY